ncbi:MAG TPA: NAD-dependent epimerase/dehydratase family protein [Bryobacteraceae bacterium]|nr:NAD-dependent epimerase/dehydratase family protein [Bryobacteraceae bacterium]
MRILVTGADGFVGSALCRHLVRQNHSVTGVVRTLKPGVSLAGVDIRAIGDIAENPGWAEILPGVEVAIHLAALVHQMGEQKPPLEAYRRVNTVATERLAEACVRHGVARMVFLSSIKVNGEGGSERAYSEADAPGPRDAYGVSKLEAEIVLAQVAAASSLETVIVRPPLIYGPGVRANFHRLLGMSYRMNPVPVPKFTAMRSMISLGNLTDFLSLCSSRPKAAGQLFLISDNEDVSVSDLIRRIATLMRHRSVNLPVPERALRFVASLAGREEEIRRLADPLRISTVKAISTLGWSPVLTLNGGLEEVVKWYLSSRAA